MYLVTFWDNGSDHDELPGTRWALDLLVHIVGGGKGLDRRGWGGQLVKLDQ